MLAGLGVTVNLGTATAQNTVNAGSDTLISIENLRGSTFDDFLTGSATANRIDGDAGNDTITGGAGTDSLYGGDGNDIFILTSFADFTGTEVVSGGANDDVLRFAGTTAGTLTLTANVSVETIVIGTGTGPTSVRTGTTAINVDASAMTDAVQVIGNNGANILTGSAFADLIEGAGGNDTLYGGNEDDWVKGGDGADSLFGGNGADGIWGDLGNDTMTGGAGADIFYFEFAPSTTNMDTITDFDATDDTIWLLTSAMPGFSNVGTVDASQFASGAGLTAATDADQRIIYNTSNGDLFYDSDGVGGAAAVRFAKLTNGAVLTFDDFFIY